MKNTLTIPPRPTGLLKWAFLLPRYLYRWHLGWMLGHRCLMVTHIGRKTGRRRQAVLEVVHYNRATHECIVVSGYGDHADWYRNIQAAGGCTIRWNGTEYATEKPERIDAPAALPMFPLAVRLVLQAFGIKQFVKIEHPQAAMNNRRK